MTQPITINERAAATVHNILDTIEAGRKASEHLPTYVEALGAALDVPTGWRFDVQQMAFMPPAEQAASADPMSPSPSPIARARWTRRLFRGTSLSFRGIETSLARPVS